MESTVYIKNSKLQDRQIIAAALEQIELNGLEDKTQLDSALVNFAAWTEQDLQRTRQNMAVIAEFLSDTATKILIPN